MTVRASSSFQSFANGVLIAAALVMFTTAGCQSNDKSSSHAAACCTPQRTTPRPPSATKPSTATTAAAAAAEPAKGSKWKELFNGKSMDGWKVTKFGGEGQPEVTDGEMIIPAGALMSGVSYTGELPKTNYEIEVEARRRQGSDFFVGLTFPVKDSNASLICGGWGGSLVGISSIDGMDASENNTGSSFKFEKDKWYKIRQRVTDDQLQSWIDDKQVVNTDIKDHKISVRIEVMPSRPLGIATYQTDAGIRAVRIRELTPEEVKASAEPAK